MFRLLRGFVAAPVATMTPTGHGKMQYQLFAWLCFPPINMLNVTFLEIEVFIREKAGFKQRGSKVSM